MTDEKRIETAWGPWQTAGLGLLVFIVCIITQIVFSAIYINIKVTGETVQEMQELSKSMLLDGNLLSYGILFYSIAGCIFIILFAWLRAKGGVKVYLGILPVRQKQVLIYLGTVLLLIIISDSVKYFIDQPMAPDFLDSAYDTVTLKPLLWIALCIATPVFEELLFRGFLLRGWELSRLGPAGAVILSSLIWSVIHVQYGLYDLIFIFVLGLMLGFMRVKTNSIIPGIACHAFVNLVAMIEAVMGM